MKLPIVRIVLQNAFILSVLYLVTGLLVDSAWHWDVFHGNLRAEHLVFRLSLALDALPARALQIVGLLHPIQRAYAEGRLHELALRWIFEVTTLVIIVATAFLVAGLMAVTRRLWDRPQRPV